MPPTILCTPFRNSRLPADPGTPLEPLYFIEPSPFADWWVIWHHKGSKNIPVGAYPDKIKAEKIAKNYKSKTLRQIKDGNWPSYRDIEKAKLFKSTKLTKTS